ncbi:MAG: 16S rRNA (cytidine(1402)-2'-O)-methyltransferase [Ignavibacteriales bacterium]|nr:16S rRNA (cytidine(1402)-2'-O)-methyltransferase [Ignavibacteriales bacterium]
MTGKLYLVSTPIGNYGDITLRAIETLKSVNFIICEEFREARRLLSHYKIEKELVSLNEHNEKESAEEIIPRLLDGESAALISDCGTPLFSDPGHHLVDLCLGYRIDVVPVPGVNSLLPAITVSGLSIEKFYYYGWLSPKKDERRLELFKLKNINEVLILLDTPYRLKTLLSDIAKTFNPNTVVVLAFELTKETEKFFRGTVADVLELAEKQNLKGEFVLIIDNRNSGRSRRE